MPVIELVGRVGPLPDDAGLQAGIACPFHFGGVVERTVIVGQRVQQVLLTEFDAICAGHGLTFARYEALVLLAFSREGRLPMGKIGQRLMVHPTSATNIIQRLDAQGFVTRAPNPADGRGTLAAITPAGRDAMEAVTTELVRVQFGLEALSTDEREQLITLLRKVRVAKGDFEGEPA